MDFNLQRWRNESEEQAEDEENAPSAKQPRFVFNSHHPQQTGSSSSSQVLPFFVPESQTYNKLCTNLSAYSSDSTTKFPRMGSYFSLAQWQELELQALIYRHMSAGAAVPPELLQLVKKSLISSSPSSYYFSGPLHQYYQPSCGSVLQSGYWGRAAMDPEPGRCRRTDGKKWRCSRDVVAGHKYCERHMHRGKNRSRKPVESPISAATPYGGCNAGKGGGSLKFSSNSVVGQATAGGDSGGPPHFSLSGRSPSVDLLHLNQRPLESIMETNDGKSSAGTLRHFFDDNAASSATNLSISIAGHASSDFSLKLGTGDDEASVHQVEGERGRPQWGAPWGTNQVAPMGGPLAEALRSSTSSFSPTSVLHQLQRTSASEAGFISA